MSDTPREGRDVDDSRLLTLSVLHCHIRALEFFLFMAYKANFVDSLSKKEITKETYAKNVAERKKAIQARIKACLNVTVDQVRPTYGNTNTGNVARKCFRNPGVFADCIGLDKDLITDFACILSYVSSKSTQDHQVFSKMAIAFDGAFKKKYAWAKYSPTIHKLLIHGSDIIRNAVLPTGFMTEEPIERILREIRDARLRFSRKHSRKNNLLDIFNHLNIKSDFIVASREITPPKNRELADEVD